MTPFGSFFEKKRLEIGINRSKMADDINVSRSLIYSIEHGKKRITPHVLNKILEYFKIENDLFMQNLVEKSQPKLIIDMRGLTDEQREICLLFSIKMKKIRNENCPGN